VATESVKRMNMHIMDHDFMRETYKKQLVICFLVIRALAGNFLPCGSFYRVLFSFGVLNAAIGKGVGK